MGSRRDFIRKTTTGTAAITLGGLGFQSWANTRMLGANDRINCAVIGVRSRARAHVLGIHQGPNAKSLYNCDVDDLISEGNKIWCEENIGYVPKGEKDVRIIMEDTGVDDRLVTTT